jgi:hypothetical protein
MNHNEEEFCWRCDGPREVIAALAIIALVLIACLI